MPRSFPVITADSRILELFATSSSQMKAHRVLLLLRLPRSKIRNIQSALRRLARSGALVELSSLSSAQPHPLYALVPPTAIASYASKPADVDQSMHSTTDESPSTCVQTAPTSSSESTGPVTVTTSSVLTQPTVLPADDRAEITEETEVRQPVCAICGETWPTEVLLPCRHQACCKTCWSGCVVRERSVHNRHERLKRELGARGLVRSVFRPRCPICMVAVDNVISPYTNIQFWYVRVLHLSCSSTLLMFTHRICTACTSRPGRCYGSFTSVTDRTTFAQLTSLLRLGWAK